jgi:signal transduction histidine kinase
VQGHAGPQALRRLVDAVVTVGEGLDLHAVLQRIVETAADLVDARYGALGLIDESGERLSDFITVGVTDEERSAIGDLPKGLGLLGHIIEHAEPLRLADLAEHPDRYGFPPGHPPMHSLLGVPIRVRGEVFGNLYLTEKQSGEVFTDVDEELVVGLATAAAVAIENARLFERTRHHEAVIEALSEVAAKLVAGTARDDVLHLIATRARELVGGDLAAISLLVPDHPPTGGRLQATVADGDGADSIVGEAFSASQSVAGEVLRTGRPVMVDDVGNDPRVAQQRLRQGFGPALFVPLTDDDGPYGALSVIRLRGSARFTAGDAELLGSFATQANVVLELDNRRAQLDRLTLLESQERIARDLHDSAIQRIFAASLMLTGTASQVGDGPLRERIEQAVDELDTATRLIRGVIFDISSRSTSGEPVLRRRVLEVAGDASRPLGFSPHVTFDGPVDTVPTPDQVRQLVHTLREALSNVARHAHASSADIRITATGTELELTVTDDGAGFSPERLGNGVGNMRARAESLGGSFDIGTGPAGGTQLHWSVPVGA